MKNVINIFKLKYEAELLDSKYFIIKAFCAVLVAYVIGKSNSLISVDMISVLFGLILTLEPVSLAGFRSGMNQVYASILGALSTSLIIFVGGNNMFTVALAVAFTIYVCLKINWREISPVAIFTSIYMTQFVQVTSSGVPSLLLTFRLRILALGMGIFVAIFFNFIFSLISYRKMMYKRVRFVMDKVILNLEETSTILQNGVLKDIQSFSAKLPSTFIDIDWISSLFEDMKKEYKVVLKNIGVSKVEIENLSKLLFQLRTITHLNYDMVHLLAINSDSREYDKYDLQEQVKEIDDLVNSLKKYKEYLVENKSIEFADSSENIISLEENKKEEKGSYKPRFISDILEIQNIVNNINRID
ncbi:FUSC family protein [Clostridium grantii]|uniref:Aromatic acid exporter family member 1 n=1 Tax=Clostridium grantii DSM 8605 TaxID=1121316 RepID=A0A1M5UNX1_9CLOT|nr:aromatic acid exporter family protein [Clostridium grantii]SHH64586.1 Aromatic acid exporter family member 1 [Clostridium grantii DSM 8605]